MKQIRFQPKYIGLYLILFMGLLLACGPNLSDLLKRDEELAPVAELAENRSEQAEVAPEEKAAAAKAGQEAEGASQVPAPAVVETNTADLREAVTIDGMRRHLEKLQAIAEANDGRRASGTSGYAGSAGYVAEQLAAAGYQVAVQPFEFRFFQDKTVLQKISPVATSYRYGDDFAAMTFSPAGQAAGVIESISLREPLRGSANSGCDPVDFVSFTPGNIALIKRGICPFAQKAQNAEDAGASAVLILNDAASPERARVVFGTLGEDHQVTIPVVGLSFALGEELFQLSQLGQIEVEVKVEVIDEMRETVNVIADTPGGRDDFIIVVGGHLDSVPTGPGIQDNGSGVAAILEIALQMAALELEPRNKVRFAFWGAEEFGLLGSRHYVETLGRAERDKIALNLNFDMIASPNYSRFVYDGDLSRFPTSDPHESVPKEGSGAIEQVFQAYFEAQGLELTETPFDGRSDYGPFMRADIPAGGLFTGAEEAKPRGEVSLYGGTADEAYDGCYHQECDTIDNVNWQALNEMADAAAHAVIVFAMTDQPVEETVGQ